MVEYIDFVPEVTANGVVIVVSAMVGVEVRIGTTSWTMKQALALYIHNIATKNVERMDDRSSNAGCGR